MLHIDMYPSGVMLTAMFHDLEDKISRYEDPLRQAIEQVVIPSMLRNFDNEQGPDGPWAALNEATQVIRSREGSGHTILMRTLNLYGGVQASLPLWDIDDEAAVFDSSEVTEYGSFHMTGTRHMPARPWAWIDEEGADEIVEVFGDWLDVMVDEALPRAAFGLGAIRRFG
jgi:phage gpG-like protein